MAELPNDSESSAGDGTSRAEPGWQNRVRAIFRWRSVKTALVVAAIAILASTGYLAYRYATQRTLEAESQNNRPVIAIIDAAIEAVDEKKLKLTLRFKNLAAKTAHSLVIAVVGFNPKTEGSRQLATIASTDPMRRDISFTSNAAIERSELLPVMVLCLLYADEDKRGFADHLYYGASVKPQVGERVELRKLSRDEHRHVDDAKVCRL